jgi:hypothetical protein
MAWRCIELDHNALWYICIAAEFGGLWSAGWRFTGIPSEITWGIFVPWFSLAQC